MNKQLQFLKIKHALFSVILLFSAITITTIVSSSRKASLEEQEQLNTAASMILLNDGGSDGVNVLDLRGTICYPQLDKLVSCGQPDTLSILLFTKSEEPIRDIIINLDLDDGLQFGGFAEIGTPDGMGMSLLDSLNTANAESPTFRLSELSQAGGAVVLQFGIQAQCGHDFVADPPGISLNLDYNGCMEEILLDPIDTEPLTPEVVFTGAPASTTITDLDTEFCMTQNITQVTLDASTGEATLTISDFGYPDISLDNILVGGVAIPSSDIMIDANGLATIVLDGNANPALFGGDGILDQNEMSPIDFCFSMSMCPAVGFVSPFNPNLSIAGTCNGILCGGNIDFEQATLAINPNFGTRPDTEFTTIQDAAICDPMTGAPQQYIFDVSTTGSRPEEIQGSLYNLLFNVDECPGGPLLPDSVQVFTGGSMSGSLTTLPLSGVLFRFSANGRLTISLRALDQDYDGAGGLTDIDGDGSFDDVLGSDTVRIRVYLGPISCGDGGACGQDDSQQMQSCQFFQITTAAARDCGLRNVSVVDAIDPLSPPIASNSLSEYTNIGLIGTGNNAFPGYNFGTVGNTPGGPVSSTIPIVFDYTIDPNDFAMCPAPGGTFSYQVFYLGDSLTAENMEMSNVLIDGNPGTVNTINMGTSTLFEIPAGDGTPGLHTLEYELTIDTFNCGPANDFLLITRVVEECPICDCSPIIRTCQTAVLRSNLDDSPNCTCDVMTAIKTRRINYGYTDRTQSTSLTDADFPGDDHPQLDKVLPGDTIEIVAEWIVTNAEPWNNRTERLGFNIITLQGASTRLPNVLGRLDLNAVQITEADVIRGATAFPFSDIQPVGDILSNRFNGINLHTSSVSAANVMKAEHPGLNPGTFKTSNTSNSSVDYLDGAIYRIYFWGEDRVLPGQLNGLQALYDLVGGAFETDDTVRVVLNVPVMLTPDLLANGDASQGPLNIDKSPIRASVDGRDLTPSGALSGNFIGGGSIFNGANGATACVFQDTLCYMNPGIQLESIIDYSEDICAAEIRHNFTIQNPLDADCFNDPVEYRPLIGVERLFSEFPEPYIYEGGATYELLGDGNGPTIYEPDSIASVDTIDTYFCATNRYGELYFVDAETKNGLRDVGYDCLQDDSDVVLSGGTFPLLGVGAETSTDPDTLQFTIPIIRLCTDIEPETPVDASFEASYPYLSDYRVSSFTCNNGSWYGLNIGPSCSPNPGPDGRFYWPWTRDSLNNPHRIQGSLSMDEIGTPVPSFTLEATVAADEIADTGGGEMNTVTICPVGAGPITQGVYLVEIPTNVSLDSSTPALTQVSTTSTSTIYSADLTSGTPNGACFDFVLETSLIFCGPDDICSYALPCDADPDLVLAKDLDCLAKICYRYRAGEPEIQAGFNFPVNPTPCATDNFEINFNNTGTSYFTDVDPVIYLPVGIDPVLPFIVELTDPFGGTTTAAVGGMLDPALSGTNGNAYTIDVALLEALLGPEGFEPLEGLAFMFSAEIGCEFTSGTMPAALFRAEGDCEPFEFFDRGQPINTVPPESGSEFDIQVDDLEINCTEGGADVQITTLNVGKNSAGMTRVCIQLPADVMLDPADIEVLAPIGFTVNNPTTAPLGTSGDMEVSFDGPATLDVGGFFCVNLRLDIDADQECGILEVGFQVKSVVEVVCPSEPTGNCSMESIVASEILPFEVVPAASVGDATLIADCNADPNLTDLEFELTLESLGTPFNGMIDVELFYDLDNNGMVDPFDTSLGMTMASASIPSNGTGTVNGAITVPGETACSIVAKLSIPGCGCSMLEIPFPEIEPAFLDALGDNVAVCPGEPFVIEDICGELEMEFMPAAAGSVVIDDVTGTATIMLNPGFGIDAAVMLMTNFSIGACVDQEFVTKVRSVGDFNFGPYEVIACSDLTTELDFGIPSELQDDIMVTITPGTFLDDPNSIEPSFINPTSNQSYLVEFSLNGQCTSTSTIDLIVTDRSEVTVDGMFEMCDTILDLEGIVEIDPPVDADWLTTGDGTFEGGTDVTTAMSYIPGPGDIAAGMVTLLIETMEEEPCGNSLTRVEVSIELDTIAPEILCPNDICVPNDPDWCGATLNLPPIAVEDNCSDDANIDIEYNINLAGWTDVSPNNQFFPNDTTSIGIRVTDEAGNMDSCFFNFIVKEKQAPEVICSDLVINLGETGNCDTTIDAMDLGGLSTDECEIAEILIGLDTMPGDLMSSFMITGLVAPVDTTFELFVVAIDTSGNQSFCLSNVRILCGVPPAPAIGLAKRTTDVDLLDNGCVDVTYEFNIQNYGNVELTDIVLTDDLTAAFASCASFTVDEITSDDFIVNGAYDGAPATSMLLGLDTLQAGDKGAVLLTVQACGCVDGDIMNTASVEATGPDGTVVEDDSTDGSNPDDDGDGDPTNDGDPTITSLMTNPSIGGAKRVADATLNPDGSFVVLYEINIENYGDVSLADIQAMDDLAATFPAPCAIENLVVTSDDFTVNPAYDGVAVTDLLTGNDTLQINDKGAILIEVTVASCAGVGPFENEATVSGTAPDGTEVEDDTVNGSEPDGDGDGDPTNDDSPTPFTLEEDAVLGVAKYVKEGPTSNGDGTFNISFGIRLENLGNVDLSEISLTDDLAEAFAGCDYEVSGVSSEEFAVNLDYDGDADTELIDQTAPGQVLKSWDEGEVCINIVFGPCADAGPFMNSATAMGTTPAGDPVEDDSQNGSNPDPDGDGDPTNNDDPTGPITFPSTPSIGGAKRVADATLNPDGSFVVLYEINIENYGDVSLADIQAMDDLAATFPAPCAIENLVVTSDDFTVNPAYDGVAVTDLLTGNDTLQINDKGAILIEVTVASCAGVGPFENEATVSGTAPDGTEVEDDTVNGSEPDGDGDGDPTNDDSPTPFTLEEDAVLGVAKYVKSGPINNGDGTYSISFGIRLENLGNVNIEDLSLTDDLVAAFNGCDYTVSGTSSEEFAINTSYDGDGDTELLADDQELKSWDEGEVCINVIFGPCADLGPFANSATVTGTTPAGDPVEDDSQSGSNPDPDGDGDPTNNDDDTPFEFEENGLIGVAKRIVTSQENPDGTVDITYEFNVENFGDVPILDLQVMDDLNAAFAPCMVELVSITSDDFIVDPTFAAGGNPNMLLGDDILEVGDKGAILIDIKVSACAGNTGPFMNQAEATGTTPAGDPVSDLSDNGSDPDGDNDGDPTNDSDETIISFDFQSFIGLAKDLEGIMLPGDGSAVVDIRFIIQNYGTTDLDSINLFDDVVTQFDPCDVEILLINASPGFVVNPLYDGGTASDTILTGGDNELAAGESGFVFVRYRFTMCGDGDLCFCNQGFVTAIDALGDVAFDDLSQSGTNPDPDGDLDPTNNDECTEVKFGFNPAIGIAKRVSEGPISDGMGCFDMTYEIRVENLGDQEIYGVQVVDDLSATFALAESWNVISVESEEFMIDPGYDGIINQSLLLGNDTLGVSTSGDEGAIYLKVNVCPGEELGPYLNQAFVDGTAADGSPLDDASQDGSNPDPDFEDDATDNNDPTPVSFEFNPLLGGAKRVADATLNPDGSFVVLYEINIENYGDVSLADIQAVDDLAATFPAPCAIENIVLTSDDFTVNPLYDGVGVTDLLTGADTLQVNDKGAILIEVTVAECAGVGPFVNSATVSGTAPDGTELEDDTVNGSDPDGDGDGDPTNDESPTPFTLEEDAVLGVAKYVKNGPINNGDGTFSISFGIRLENIGNVNIEELSLTDDLVTAFAGCDYEVTGVSSEEFAVNLGYDGDGDAELLDQTAPGQELKSWDEGEVCINIVFGPCANSGPFMNSATAMGTTPAGDPVEDDSQNGSNPDPDGDGDPTNNDEPTGPITFPSTPSIGGAKRVADAVLQPDGSFVVIYEINIENFGDVSLADIQAMDDLAATFPAPCAIENLVVTSDDFTVNPLYDGVAVTDLLTGADTLQVDDKGAILIEVTVAECAGVGPFVNSATVSGTGPDGTPVEDDTVNGSEPDGDGDGDPTNDDSGTPFTLEEDAVLGVAKYVKDGPINNGDGTFSISFGIRLENLGNVNIGELSLTDDLVAAFAGCDYEVSGVSSEEFAVNLAYDGDANTELLDQTAPGQELKSWDEGEVCINIVFGPCTNEGPFMNSATAMGTTPAGDPIEDDSQNGSNPDPDGDGDPTNNDDPTGPITFPTNPDIGIAKREVSVTIGDDGCYQVTYEFNIENIGDVSLNSIQVEDDLAGAGFGDCGDFSVASITSDDFVIDPAYDGDGNNNMLLGSDDLPVGDKGAILLVVEACACPTGTEIMNTATVTAETPAGDPIEDDSSPGSDVDPGDDGEDDTDENDTTNTTLEEDADFGLAKRVVTTNLTADGCTEIVYEFNIQNLGNVTITDIQVEDDLAAAGFGDCGSFTTSITSDEFTVDPAFDGMGNNNLLLGLDNIVPGDVGAILLTVEACGCPNGTMIGNTATLTGTSPGGDMLEDNSVDGSDPDPDGMGEDGTDEMSSTDFEITEAPDFGIAKREVGVWLQDDGCALVTYEINVENLGNVEISGLQVEDNLVDAGFGACNNFSIKEISSDDFLVNGAYDGDADDLLLTGTDILEEGDKGAILFTVEACGCPNGTDIANSATGTGMTPAGDPIEDMSVDGSNPDPDGMGETDTDEMSTTNTDLDVIPSVGIAKRQVTLVNNDDGSATVTYEFNIENFGNIDLQNIQATDDLATIFAPCNDIEILSITSDDFTVNGAYNGVGDLNMLIGDDDLPAGDQGAILLTINVDGCGGDTGPFLNQATLTADSPDGTMLMDLSQDGSDPDPDGDGDPTNNDDPTETEFEFMSFIGIAKAATQVINNADGSSTVTFEFNVENFGNQILTELQVVDNLGLAFNPCADIEILSLTSDDYQVNVNYDGVTDLELLAGVDDIDPGDVGGILLTINVDDCMGVTGTFINSAFVSALDPSGMDVFDDFSQNGTNPDPDGDGDPTNNNDGTPVDFGFDPDFGVAKRLSYGPILSTEGCYDITFEIKVENFGDVDLANIQVEEDLTAVFGAGDIWSVISLESEEFDVNTAFDGIGEVNLLSGLDTLVNQPGGNEGAIYLGLNVCPDGMTDPYLNSVTGTATSPDGTLLTDVSQDGSDPDPDGNGDPSDNNDPTPFQLMCEIPMFTNCPRPPVIVDAPEGWCSAFVNFSPPLAEAECGLDTIQQVDMTGLDTGDLFPVGTTILKWVAIDIFGNVSDTCIIKIVVNDFHTPPTIVCPDDVVGENDPGVCGAVVSDIEPPADGITDNCPDNLAVTYTIEDAAGGTIGCGINDASGYLFPVGTSTVTYNIQDQPILLISEILQDGLMTGIEITNFGPASYDISCLVIGREGATPEEYIVDDITIVGVGDVFTQIFTPITAGAGAGYYISYMNNFIDAVSINGYISPNYTFTGSIFGDNIVRSSICDTDSSDDWFATTGCDAGSFGFLNPGLDILPDNGTTTSLQSEAPSTASCSFTVTIDDTEAPYCAEYDTTAIAATDVPLPLMQGACTSSTITIGTSFQVGDVNVVDLVGTYADMGGVTATLVSPAGTEVVLFSNLCSMTADFDITLDDASLNSQAGITCAPLGGGMDFQPIEALKKFFGEEAMGDWSLEVYTALPDMGTVNSWMLEVSELAPYSQIDTCLNNDPGLCSAEFTWMHPRVGDNCCIGTVEVAYTTLDDIMVPTDGIVDQGTEETQVFEVGTTTVTYTITDLAGNVSMCSFDVIVKDDEPPVLDPASCQDLVIQLGPGECETLVNYPPVIATDNCGIDSIQYTPPVGHDFEIGVTDVTLVVFDAAGNSDTCMFTVTVLEFIPDTDALACNNQVNLSLGPDCMATITADMILEGDIYGCYDDYCVTLIGEDGNEIGNSQDGTNIVDLSHVGQTITVEICVDCTEETNCCWGFVTIEEKLLPQVECPADTTIMCNEAHDPIATGEPIVMSCEPDLEVTYIDDYQDNGLCGNPRVIIDRTWTITDADGNSVECIQQIVVLPFDLNSVEFPENFVLSDAYDCSDVEADPTLTDAENTGYPTINGKPIFGDHFCEVNVGFWDEHLDDANCLGSYEILRNWIIRDECLPLEPGVNPRRHIQAIKVNDTHAPVFAEIPSDITISTDVWNCHASYTLELPQITDDCGIVSDIIVNVEGGSVTESNGVFTLTNMVHGDHNVRIRAGDQCHNYAEVEFNIHVEDKVAPNVVCIGQVTVSLSNNGHAKLFPESIDDGSFDNCGGVFLQVYRMETSCGYPEDLNPGEFVNLCCSDIGDAPTMVALRVWDDASKDGIYGNFGDNYSECMIEVTVEDKNTNGIGCPPDVTITCDQDYTNLDLTGAPSLTTVCDMASASYTDNLDNYNQCGIGYVLRTWSIEGENINCVQRIDIDAFDPFQESDIIWPADYTGTCMDDVPDVAPTFSNNSCNLLGVNVESDTFYFESDACYKVLNEWTVIDWCTYDADNPNSGGIWSSNQVIKILDDIAPVITDCADVTVSTLNSDCILDVLTISNSATDNNCGIGAEMSWYYQVDFDGDGNIDETGELEGSSVSTSFSDVAVGTVTVIWVVTDGCGNSTPCTQDYIIEDGIAPEPYCIALTSSLGQDGSVELWATDFDQGSTDNCTPQNQLIISFTEDGMSPNRTFTCEDVPNGVAAEVPVEIWIIDAFGNASFCNTSLTLTDNNNVCEDEEGALANLEGNVLTEDNQGVNDVHVVVEEMNSGEIYETESMETGQYGMSVPMPVGIDYMITPARDDNHLNGVSTLDVFKIQRHVLGIEKLDSPYKLIAADVNSSESVSAVDLVELQKIILGYTDEFPANSSWRFVNSDYEFGDETDPWPFEEVIELTPLLFSTDSENFVGVKVGDVNGSANPQLQGLHVAPRTDASIGMRIQDRIVEKGEYVEILISFEDVDQVSAFQGMWKVDTEKAEVQEIDGSTVGMSRGNFGPANQVEQGIISFAWTSPERTTITTDQFIKLSIKAKGRYNLSELIRMEEGRTPGIAYEISEQGEIVEKKVELRFTAIETGVFAVAQNTPNPFTRETQISYEVPVNGMVEFKVIDAIGKVVISETLISEEGENVIVLKDDRFQTGGVYHYEITYDGNTEVRKMILVK